MGPGDALHVRGAGVAPLGWDDTSFEPVAQACVALLSDWFPATTGEIDPSGGRVGDVVTITLAVAALTTAGGRRSPILLVVIVACEIAFWLVLAAGLTMRYLWGGPRSGAVVLALVPVVDLILVTASIADPRTGGEAGTTHGLAAVYLGVSITFGPVMVRWADARFAHRYAYGPPPARPPKFGVEKTRYEWTKWRRCAVALGIAVVLTLVMSLLAESGVSVVSLWNFTLQLAIVTVAWFVVGPLRFSLFPAREPRA